MKLKVDPLSRRYGARLRVVRKTQGLRQVDVAARLEMSAGGYSSVERGYARMFVSDLERYAAALGVELAYLARKLGLCDDTARDIKVAEGADLLSQLSAEAPDLAESILDVLRKAREIGRTNQQVRTN